jgi:hypothetical protein
VVDGLDEAGIEPAGQLLDEARHLTLAWPQTTVMLTTRPVPSLQAAAECRTMPDLSEEEAKVIIDMAAGRELGTGLISRLPTPVKASLHRPLFAILLGLVRRDGPGEATPRSSGDLLAFLGEQAQGRVGSGSQNVLEDLAVRSVLRALGPVPASELSDTTRVGELLASGIVAERPGGLVLGLPILAQWFAAQALLKGKLTAEDLLTAPEDIDLWRYVLAVVVATASHDDAAALLAPIMRQVPAFAFLVIDEGLASATLEGIKAPPWRLAGEQMREAMQAIADGLGSLSQATLPVRANGQLLPLAVGSGGQHVDHAFYYGTQTREPVFRLADDDERGNPFSYRRSGFSAVGRGSAWAWRWARDELRRNINEVFKRRALPYSPDSPLARERAWAYAIKWANRPPLFGEPVDVRPLLKQLGDFIADGERQDARGVSTSVGGIRVDARDIYEELRMASDDGEHEISPPVPGADVRNPSHGIVGAFFSDDRLVEVATVMYEQALLAYQDIIACSFGSVRDRLALAVTLPAVFNGRINPNDHEEAGFHHIPTLTGYFDPLPAGQRSGVQMSISRAREEWDAEVQVSRETYDRLRALRPDAARWITSWSGGGVFDLGVSHPVSNLVYQWLWRDLSHAHITSGLQPNKDWR